MGRLIILDPSLRRRAGHHFNYAAALHEVANKRGMGFVVFGNQAVEDVVSCELPVVPAFRVDTYQGLETPGLERHTLDGLSAHEYINAAAISSYLFDDLRQIERHLEADDVVFFHTLSHKQLIGLAQWVTTSATLASKRPKLVFLFRFWHPFTSIVAPLFKFGASVLKGVQLPVRICTDTIELSVAYGEMTGVPVDVVPIPHTPGSTGERPEPGAGPLVSYLGHVRSEKGSHFLDAVLETVIGSGVPVRFVVQRPPAGEGDDLLAKLEAIRARSPAQLELVESDLPWGEYNRQLDRSNIVLCSYDPTSYRYRSSGVFIEAASAGKIAVVPARSSLMTEAQRFQCAAVPFAEFNAGSVAAATLDAVRRCGELMPVAEAARARVHAYHNADGLMDYLVG